jgi:hypothetical protein
MCCGVMVEAVNHHLLHPTSILEVYKVFNHLHMLWMVICMHRYTDMPVQVGAKLWKIGVSRGPNDTVVSWLRLLTTPDCIPHPYRMYKSD